MPRCQYRCQASGLELNATFPAPKKVTDLDAWAASAVKALSSDKFPGVVYRGKVQLHRGWTRTGCDVTAKWITYTFHDPDGVRSNLVVDRSFQSLGSR